MTKKTALSVNLNKVALVRNTRHLGIPSVLRAATLCIQAGAKGITVHPRPDARHIRTQDVHDLHALLQQWPQAEYNIEGNPFHNLMDFLRSLRPQQATFVPDAEDQFTSDHGWRFPDDAERLAPLIAEAHALGVRVSLFMDPEPAQMRGAREAGPAPGGDQQNPALHAAMLAQPRGERARECADIRCHIAPPPRATPSPCPTSTPCPGKPTRSSASASSTTRTHAASCRTAS